MINRVILVGNLGRDPELRYLTNGSPVASLSLATSRSWFDKVAGTRKDETEWHRVVVWGKQAEACKEHLSKGRLVYVEGRLQTRDWEDKNGDKRRTTEVVAESVRFLGGRGGGAQVAEPPAQTADDDQPQDDLPF